jgi:hypothetical protein
VYDDVVIQFPQTSPPLESSGLAVAISDTAHASPTVPACICSTVPPTFFLLGLLVSLQTFPLFSPIAKLQHSYILIPLSLMLKTLDIALEFGQLVLELEDVVLFGLALHYHGVESLLGEVELFLHIINMRLH